MANNLFMEIDGIPGESEQDGYEGLVQIESWAWAMDQEGSAHRGGGSGTGRVDVGDLVVTKYTDKSTPIMYTKCATGEHIDKIVLHNVKAGGVALEYLTMTMEEVIITHVGMSCTSEGDRSLEDVAFSFARYTLSYTAQKGDGSGDAAVEVGFDIAKNKAS